MTMLHLLKQPQCVLDVPFQQTLIRAALTTVTLVYSRTICFITRWYNSWAIRCLSLTTDVTRTVYAYAYCDKIDVFGMCIATGLLILSRDEYVLVPFDFPCKTTANDLQVDFLFAPQTNRHVVLLHAPDERAVYVYISHTQEMLRYSTSPQTPIELFTCYWLCDEIGSFLSSDACTLFSTFEDYDLPCMETILKVDYLYNIGRWLIQMHDTCFVLDRAGMRFLLAKKNKLQLIAEIDGGRLNCMYASTTTSEIRVTVDHTIMLYVYKHRICAARTVYPFRIYPSTKLHIPRDMSDPVLRIRYLESDRLLQVFCLRHIYTFSMSDKSFTDSTSIATTLE